MEEYNYYDILCDSISSLRKQKEMTQEQVAGQLGIGPQSHDRDGESPNVLVRILVCCRRLPGCLIRTIDGLFGIQTESVQPQVESRRRLVL